MALADWRYLHGNGQSQWEITVEKLNELSWLIRLKNEGNSPLAFLPYVSRVYLTKQELRNLPREQIFMVSDTLANPGEEVVFRMEFEAGAAIPKKLELLITNRFTETPVSVTLFS